MTATKTFVMRHPVVTYFVLTFLISWGGILVVLGPGAFTGATEPTEALLPLVYLAMFAGPSIAGILAAGGLNGHERRKHRQQQGMMASTSFITDVSRRMK